MTFTGLRMSHNVQVCAEHLAAGGLLGLPTETVYGLAADAQNDVAVRAVFSLKGRPADHPLIVHVAADEPGATPAWAHFAQHAPEWARTLMQAFWPGPLTLVLPRRPEVASVMAAGLPTVAVRCPSHPLAQQVLVAARALGVFGVAAPSANRFGRISPTLASHVVDEFAGHADSQTLCVLDGGACDVGIESTIVDASRQHPVLLRPGMLDRATIEAVPERRCRLQTPRRRGSRARWLRTTRRVRRCGYGPRRIWLRLCRKPGPGWRCTLGHRCVSWRQRCRVLTCPSSRRPAPMSCLPSYAPWTPWPCRPCGCSNPPSTPVGTACATGCAAPPTWPKSASCGLVGPRLQWIFL